MEGAKMGRGVVWGAELHDELAWIERRGDGPLVVARFLVSSATRRHPLDLSLPRPPNALQCPLPPFVLGSKMERRKDVTLQRSRRV
jgi:hypothetical protein